MSNHSITASTTEARALDLLGSGVGPEQTAAALGVTVSAISQFLADETFANKVAEARYRNLLKHNNRDSEYDSLEDSLIKRMKDIIPYLSKPFEILRAIQVINGAKRRGMSAPEHITQQQTVISLNLPVQIVQHFQVNQANQVVRAGNQDLITVQSGRMAGLATSLLQKGNANVELLTQGAASNASSGS
jgi:hypothetical protein